MFWPDTQTGVDVEPARKTVQSAVRKYFTEGGVGVPPTVPGGDWFNQITNELLNVLAAAGIDPSKSDDDQLLEAIKRVSNSTSAREALRRSYAEAGYPLVEGSFEVGGTLTSTSDVLLYEANGQAYSWTGAYPVGGLVVTPETNPLSDPVNWQSRSLLILRSQFMDGGNNIYEIAASAHVPSGLDLTGVINETLSIAALWDKWSVIRLPRGKIRADIHVPSGCVLLGSGQQGFDRGTATWDGLGTLVVGAINFNSSKNAELHNLSIDSYALGSNPVSATNDQFNNIKVTRVTTRASNHGQLWEQNSTYADGRSGGDVIVEDCLHYGGPNGYVTKAKNILFRRCHAFDVTVQSHVAASDNINGQGVFSRATGGGFEDCKAIDCNEGCRVYSRNYHPGVDTVAGAGDIRWVRGVVSGANGRHVRTGDFSSSAGSYERVQNTDISVDDGLFGGSVYSAIRFENVTRPRLTGSPLFANNLSNLEFGDSVFAPLISDKIAYSDAPDGAESRVKVSVNEGNLRLDSLPTTVIFQNTSTTYVSNAVGLTGVFEYLCEFCIQDDFTICTFTGITHKGKGTTFRAHYNGVSWVDHGESMRFGAAEWLHGSGASCVFDLSVMQRRHLWNANNVNITNVSLTNQDLIPPGEIVTLRITTAATAITIGGWDASIKWPDGQSAPTSLGAFRKIILQLYRIPGAFVVIGQTIYA